MGMSTEPGFLDSVARCFQAVIAIVKGFVKFLEFLIKAMIYSCVAAICIYFLASFWEVPGLLDKRLSDFTVRDIFTLLSFGFIVIVIIVIALDEIFYTDD